MAQWGASLAFYTIVSLPPLLILLASISGALLVPEQLGTQLTQRLSVFMSQPGTEVVQAVLQQIDRVQIGSVRAIPTVLVLLVGGTAVFVNVQAALNRIWGIDSKGSAVGQVLRTRLMSLLMILCIGAVFILSFFLTAATQLVAIYLSGTLLDQLGLIRLLDIIISGLVYWALFALTYRVLPDARIEWRDVALGSLISALLFLLGKELIAAYLARSGRGTPFGAAGSVFLFLMWVYYSAQLFLMGAVFTRVWAVRRGRTIESRWTTTPGSSGEPRLERVRPSGAD